MSENRPRTSEILSWGLTHRYQHSVFDLNWRSDPFPSIGTSNYLAYGAGRSYGDVCLNQGGSLIVTSGLRRLLAFDALNGTIRCEAGVTLRDLLNFIVPRGFILPVLPGTAQVTVGGAIANDIHGKNHHRMGTFGLHLLGIEVLRSDGSTTYCTPTQNSELFNATIGGLGLTGVILSAEIKLRPITSAVLEVRHIPFVGLDEFLALAAKYDSEYEYSVAWIDSLSVNAASSHASSLVGVYMLGNHSQHSASPGVHPSAGPLLQVPVYAPSALLNRHTIKLFNKAYYQLQRRNSERVLVPYATFFFPLDWVGSWNRLYGKRGFYQFQCVVPNTTAGVSALSEILKLTAGSGSGSFLSVLKLFGSIPSPGLLSFPRPGLTVALDIANRGEKTTELLKNLEQITSQAKGAIYPAKDACMSAESFFQYFPRHEEFKKYIDPRASSSFWRRTGGRR